MSFQISPAQTSEERNECYRLRHIVFVEEQGVPVELEIDEHDETDALHYLGRLDDEPVAAARICVFGEIAKIQRVVVLKEYRDRKFGKDLMQFLMNKIREDKLAKQIVLDAQADAIGFYEALGFAPEGDIFDDAGIPHIHMRQPS